MEHRRDPPLGRRYLQQRQNRTWRKLRRTIFSLLHFHPSKIAEVLNRSYAILALFPFELELVLFLSAR